MKLTHLNTIAAIFDVFGGRESVQELTGDKKTTVANWYNWNVCPANTYDPFLRELAKRGYWAPPELFAQRQFKKGFRKKRPKPVTTHRQVHKGSGNGRNKRKVRMVRQPVREAQGTVAEIHSLADRKNVRRRDAQRHYREGEQTQAAEEKAIG